MEDERQARLEALYREVVDLGDRARRWFDGPGVEWRAGLPVDAQAMVAVESLGITGRLLGVMAWLLDPVQLRGQPPIFVLDATDDDLPAGSPLIDTPGGEVAVTTRKMLNRVRGLAGAMASDAEPPGESRS
jgi:hypothetical protein